MRVFAGSNPAAPARSLPELTGGSFQAFRCKIEQDRQQHQVERIHRVAEAIVFLRVEENPGGAHVNDTQ